MPGIVAFTKWRTCAGKHKCVPNISCPSLDLMLASWFFELSTILLKPKMQQKLLIFLHMRVTIYGTHSITIILGEVSTSTVEHSRTGRGSNRARKLKKKSSYKHVPHSEKPPQVSCCDRNGQIFFVPNMVNNF